MSASIRAVYFFILSSGALFVGTVSQAVPVESNSPQGGGNQYGGSGAAPGQAGEAYNDQNRGGGPPYGDNGSGNSGQYGESGPAGNGYPSQNQESGPTTNQKGYGFDYPTGNAGGQNGGNGPAAAQFEDDYGRLVEHHISFSDYNGGHSANENQYPNQNGSGNPVGTHNGFGNYDGGHSGNQNRYPNQYVSGDPAFAPTGSGYTNQNGSENRLGYHNGFSDYDSGHSGNENRYPNKNGSGGPAIAPTESGGPNFAPTGSGYPNQNESGNPAGNHNSFNDYDGGHSGNENLYPNENGSGGPAFAPTGSGYPNQNGDSGPASGQMGSRNSGQFGGRSMGGRNMISNMNAELPDPEDLSDLMLITTESQNCENCSMITSLPIFVDNKGIPVYNEIDKTAVCGKPRLSARTMTAFAIKDLECGGNNKAIGMAWRYEPIEPKDGSTNPDPKHQRYIRYLAIVCDADDACSPFLGVAKDNIWTGNPDDQPHNSSLCVPGDHLTGVDIIFKGEFITEVRTKCCTSSVKPTCNMKYKQLLKTSVIPETPPCSFCCPQLPLREELVIHDNGRNIWHSKKYKAALHRPFLRALIGKSVEIHKNSTRDDFNTALINPDCPFNGTNLLPNEHLEFFVAGGEQSDGCGLPATQRVFISEEHGIEYLSKTARAVEPGSNRAVEIPKSMAWARTDPCLEC